jgi:alpha-tubulin suppressor-like RCC1 family protein
MSKDRASVVFFSGDANAGNVSRVEPLLGHCVSNICGVDDQVFGITGSFIFDIDKNKQIPIGNITDMSAGKKHVMALSRSGRIYTWGSGEYGELGHGSIHRQVKEPKQIQHEATFVSISCGNDHSAAVDSKGNMYAWGQNFDRQLGLYKKTESKLPQNARAHVENMMMVPKFLPFSLLNPVQVVACGSRFTVAITKVQLATLIIS